MKLAYSGPGYSERTDGKPSFSDMVGTSTGSMVGLIARFRNEAMFGEDVAAERADFAGFEPELAEGHLRGGLGS